MLTIQCGAAEIRRLMQLHGELRDALWQLLSRRRLANFAASGWLEGLGPEERRELLRYCRVSRVLRGACVQRKGRPVEQVWIPLSGALVGASGRGGSTAIGPGSVYGGRTLGAATASDLRVSAKVDMLCIRIPKSDYACIEQQFPQFARRLEAAARLV